MECGRRFLRSQATIENPNDRGHQQSQEPVDSPQQRPLLRCLLGNPGLTVVATLLLAWLGQCISNWKREQLFIE